MKKIFTISGMHCASCASIIEKNTKKLSGIQEISVNVMTGKWTCIFDEKIISEKEIQTAIKKSGFKVENDAKKIQKNAYPAYKWILSGIFSAPIFFSMFSDEIMKIPYYNITTLIFWTCIVLVFWFRFRESFLKKILTGNFNMDSLISIGSGTALLYSWYAFYLGENFHHFLEGASFIITFILLGKYLEQKTKEKTGDALKKLLELQVKNVTILEKNIQKEIPIEEVKIGMILLIKTGGKIPLDGIVVSGDGYIDTSMLTGESMPINVKKNMQVFSGSILTDGNIQVLVKKEIKDSMIQKIIDLVESTQNKKTSIEHLADRVSGIFVPIIIFLAAGTFLAWYGITSDIQTALLPAISVLVIACPCALWLATPTAIITASGRGARSGILIKNPEVLEISKKITTVVLDKTGTVTEWKPSIEHIHLEKNTWEILGILRGCTEMSTHPFSKALSNYIEEKNIPAKNIHSLEEIRGYGLEAFFDKEEILIGNKKLLEKHSISIQDFSIKNPASSLLYIAKNKKHIWTIELFDTPKKNSKKTISLLKNMGIKTILLTGDAKNTAEYIRKNLGIDTVIAEVLPHEKQEVIKKLQDSGEIVAFVGDGINDSPALVQSNVAIAMGTGTDIAIESASMVITSGNPLKIPESLLLSKKTYVIIKQNLFWAFFYNTIMIPLAMFGFLLPMFASFAMSFSSISVVWNSLRIRKMKL